MPVCAVIAEYNPFHKGHEYHLQATRRLLGEETGIVVIMSGSFVQRGDFAFLDRYRRAEAALCGGADLVLQLPLPFALSSAERFAEGGVRVAMGLGIVTHLSFGCENGSLPPLLRIAQALEVSETQQLIADAMADGRSYPAARQAVIRELLGEDSALLSLPNSTLGIEYLRALSRLKSEIRPVAIPRRSAPHDTEYTDDRYFLSSSSIRRRLSTGDRSALAAMTGASVAGFLAEREAARAPVSLATAERAVLARLRALPLESFLLLPDAGEGLGYRMHRACQSARSMDEILSQTKTRRYPLSRLRRMLMCAYTGVSSEMNTAPPAAVLVLGAGARGRTLLRRIEKEGSLPLIARPAAANRLSEKIQSAFALEAQAESLYWLGAPSGSCEPADSFWRRAPYFPR